ncbi:galactoside 2-alpha-L-fucosyltransferase 2-like isoform X1 [Mizuhopecten yessoensis]|uniref:galactoside 2-alpha-L-fucosyltransferase 2-like isoform X1 n=1 Tax=Mizuhopecten yessoensis TaxID=6573 RepID=UPI000B45D9FC|nr:galactoside 2-alpha-L-fucosyltransferase 2-like isoform X1 [Mizuhopecten yessoensis]
MGMFCKTLKGVLTSTKCLMVGLLVLVTIFIIHLTRIRTETDRTESESISFIDKYGSTHGIMSKFFSSVRDYGKANIDHKKPPLGTSRTESQLKSAKTHEEGLVKIKEKKPKAQELVHTSQNVTKKVGFTIATKRAPPKHYITIDFKGRLGNLLFQYASLFGIADKNYLIPVISENNELRRIFKISSQSTEKNRVHYGKTFNEKIGCAFEPAAMKLGSETNTKLNGYFQSFKYFKESEASLRGQFRFKDDLQKKAVSVFSELVAEKSNTKNGPVTYIAVHVRRGDFVNNEHISKYGYVSPGPDYLQKGMGMFRANYSNTVFVVASDDLPWCKENMKGNDVVFLSAGNTRDLDFAVMTQCNHMLMTVGSFGWWTAWLINGKTIYYTGYPRPGSQLAKQIVLEDYRPPEWIGLP